jgi:hypothetical protein
MMGSGRRGHGQEQHEEGKKKKGYQGREKNGLAPWPDVIEKAGPVDSPARVVGLVAGPWSGAVSLFCSDVTCTLH